MNEIISYALYIVIGVLAFIWLKTTILIVRQKKAAVIEVFGKFWTVKNSGLNFIFPWPLASVANIVDLEIKQLAPTISVKSKDNAFLKIPVKVQYQVIPEKIKEANYELSNHEQQIASYVTNTVLNKASESTMEELFSIKDSFNNYVKTQLNEKFVPYGYKIVDLLIDAAIPSEDLAASFNNVLIAQRKRDASKNEAEALKIQLVGEAEAEKAALILKAEAFTEYRSKIAEGNRESMAIMLGYGKMVRTTDEANEGQTISKFELINEKERIPTVLTERDILRFFENSDLREAIRSVGKNEGNVIITSGTTAGNTNSLTSEEIMALVQNMNVKQNGKIADIETVLNEELSAFANELGLSNSVKDQMIELYKKMDKKVKKIEKDMKSDS